MTDDTPRTKTQVGFVLILGAVVWWIVLRLRGYASPVAAGMADQFSAITTATSVVTVIVIIFRKRIWKWRMLHPWFVDVPVVEGHWLGTVDRREDHGSSSSVRVEVSVVIDQPTMSTVRYVQTMSNDSAEGHTEACQLYRGADGFFYLEGIYQITKREDHRESTGKRLIYYGAMRLQLDDANRPSGLKGSYWSDSQTRGTLVLKRAS